MLILRVAGLLAAAALAVSVLLYMVTGERRYLRVAWGVFRYGVFGITLILLLFLLERLLVVV